MTSLFSRRSITSCKPLFSQNLNDNYSHNSIIQRIVAVCSGSLVSSVQYAHTDYAQVSLYATRTNEQAPHAVFHMQLHTHNACFGACSVLVAEKLRMAVHNAFVLLLVWLKAAVNTEQGCHHKCCDMAVAEHGSR